MSIEDRSDHAITPDDIDRAKGPSKGDKDFGGHDAEAEGSAKSAVGQRHSKGAPRPTQAPTNRPELGEKKVKAGH